MVSLRCKMVVKAALDNLGLYYRTVELGLVDLMENNISSEQYKILKTGLMKSGFELMDGNKSALVEKIKNVVVEMVHYEDELPKTDISDYISQKLHHNYIYLSKLFTEVTCTTIPHFIMLRKIEKAKELILYDGLDLTEISSILQYSSVAQLSNQFKKVTGLTPSYFKKIYEYKKRVMHKVI